MKFLIPFLLLISAPAMAADNLYGDPLSGNFLLKDSSSRIWTTGLAYTTNGNGDIFTLGGVTAAADRTIGDVTSGNRQLIDNLSRRWNASVLYTTDGNGHVIPITPGVGPSGATGPTGNAGPTGAVGATGGTGSVGASGATGVTGATGTAGTNGTNGSNGAIGASGATGSSGANGTNGSNGAIGASGSTGATGQTGATGASGSNGTNGAVGNSGATGATGQTGASGSNGTNGAVGLTGATGATGQTGASGATGSTGLTGASGATGSSGPTWSINAAAKTSNYTVLSTDSNIKVDNTANTFTVSFPNANTVANQVFTVQNIGTGTGLITMSGTGMTTRHISTAGESWEWISDGTSYIERFHRSTTNRATFTMTIGATTTPPTLGAGGTSSCWWERSGATMHTHCEVNQTAAGTAGTGNYLYPVVPSGYAIGSTVGTNSAPTTANNGGQTVCSGQSNNSSDNPRTAWGTFQNSTNVELEVVAASIFFLGSGGGQHPLSATTVHLSFDCIFQASAGGSDWEG